jgi:sporulation protein YlmC with PRC-barrel domain
LAIRIPKPTEVIVQENRMRRIPLVVAAMTALMVPALAQTSPAGTAAPKFVDVPQDAILAERLEGLDIRNSSNENVGEIEDVVISQGRVVGYVLSVGGFLGMGDRYVVVDPSAVAVSYNTNDNKWTATMNATKDQLKAAPEFKFEGKWKDD